MGRFLGRQATLQHWTVWSDALLGCGAVFVHETKCGAFSLSPGASYSASASYLHKPRVYSWLRSSTTKCGCAHDAMF